MKPECKRLEERANKLIDAAEDLEEAARMLLKYEPLSIIVMSDGASVGRKIRHMKKAALMVIAGAFKDEAIDLRLKAGEYLAQRRRLMNEQ
jgi:methyl coenzyme M reductase subunit D